MNNTGSISKESENQVKNPARGKPRNPAEYPSISVVIPVYNAEKFLEETVESVQRQTLPGIEIVLVNDGSTDGSLAVCRRIADKDPKVKVVSQENRGLSGARNAGVAAASGEYVGFVDSDDLVYPDMYENLWKGCLAAADCRGGDEDREDLPVFIQIGREEITETKEALPFAVEPPKEPQFLTPEQFQERLLLHTGDVSFCTKLIPRDFMLAHPFEEGVLAEDFSLQMKLIDDLRGIYLLPQIGYRVVHRAGSLTRRSNPSQFSQAYVAIVEHADYVEHNILPARPGLKEASEFFSLYERLDYLLHVPIADMNKTNKFYTSVVSYVRGHFRQILTNRHLSARNRIYLILLGAAPSAVRRIHWKLRKKKILASFK